MAYLKYKEITKYFYFYKSIDIETLPNYVLDYMEKDEKIVGAYSTKRDKGIFTDRKIIIFDVNVYGKQITIIPYKSISTISVFFKPNSACVLGFVDSGYPLNLKFINLKPEDKTKLRLLYTYMAEKIVNKK